MNASCALHCRAVAVAVSVELIQRQAARHTLLLSPIDLHIIVNLALVQEQFNARAKPSMLYLIVIPEVGSYAELEIVTRIFRPSFPLIFTGEG